MTQPSGREGPLQAVFEDGLRLLAAAMAIGAGRGPAPSPQAVRSACGALRCFLKVLETTAGRDPGAGLARLRGQCQALLSPRQAPAEALAHAIEAARLARDAAAKVLGRPHE